MKVLLVSIACPPKKDPECLQVGKYLKYLSKNDVNIDVLTASSPTLFMPEDPSLEKYLEGVGKIDYLQVRENKYVNYIVRNTFLKKYHFPDSKCLFHLQIKKALSLIDKDFNIIYSRSYPLSSAILGNKLKIATQKPWIMHLSDPWFLSPLHQYEGKAKELHAKAELACISNADAVTFTSEQTLYLYQNHYPHHHHKFYFFPNVYDPDDKKELPIQYGSKLKIVHTGGLTGSRNPSVFIEVLRRLCKRAPHLANELEVVFAGEIDRQTKTIFDNCSLPFIKYVGPVSYNEAIQLQNSAHLLLLIDNDFKDEKKGIFFPSKLLDYFLTKRRVFAITSVNSETSNVLNNYLSSCFTHTEVNQMVQEIFSALDHFRSRNTKYFVADEVPLTYDAEKQSTRLKELFENLCKK